MSQQPHPPAPSRRSLGWYIIGGFLILAGATSLLWRPGRRGDQITHEVLPELAATERIEAAQGALHDWNVLLITMDTTRADHLGCYGNRGIETPTLDGLARHGVLMAQAITPVPATLPAHSSILTGLYPYHHGARANGTFRLGEENTTLAEVLHDAGYRTGAAISAFVLDSQYGTDQGFEMYHDDLTKGIKYSPQMFRERPAELTLVPVKEWLAEHADERFFFWTHFFDPHAVYLPPEPFRTRYQQNLYDGEIAYVDSQIGELLAYLDELGVRDRTLVIVTADHGEGLGEHGEQTHSLLIYDGTLHVPMIFHAPGHIDGGQVIHGVVSLVDVMPTVLDLLGVPSPVKLDGRSLLQPPPPGERAVYCETLSTMTLHGWAPLLGVRRNDYKFILAPEPEVYELQKDAGEMENLFKQRPELGAELQEVLIGFVGEDPWLAARAKQNLPMDEESARQLAALGYVATAPQEELPEDLANLPDPKVMVYHWERVQKGISMRNTGDIAGAIKHLEACLKDVPRDVFAMQILGGAYSTYGEADKAMEIYQRAAELAPNEPGLFLAMSGIYLSRGEFEQALAMADRAEALEPESGDLYILRGRIADQMGNEEQALADLNKAIELDPGTAGPRAYIEIGSIHFAARRFDEAREAFNKAIEIDSLNGEAHDGLARILIEEDKLEEAKQQLALALRFNPAQPRALATLGGILSDEGKHDAALQVLERALAMSPKFAAALNNLALTYRRQGKLEEAEAKYHEAIESAPRFDLPHLNLAQLWLSQGKEEEAMEEFRAAVRANPYNAVALANLGTYHLRAGRFEEAGALLQRALRVDPDYAMAHKYLGLVCETQDQLQRAIYHYRRSLEIDPRQPEAEKLRYALQRLEQLAATRPAEPEPELTTSPVAPDELTPPASRPTEK
jgi:arylsulfatase A-like enzyme/Tfp pilus assembly protein PilF